MSRRNWSNAILLVVSLAVSLAIAEAGCRLLLPSPGFVPRGSDDIPGLWVEHPTRGYGYALNFSGTMTREDFTITVKTNEMGLRAGHDRKPLEGTRPLVLAVGDSFTFGWGVQYEQAWPAQLESILSVGRISESAPLVVNAGVSGYGLRQVRQLSQDLVEKLSPHVVVMGVYPAAVDRLRDPFVLFHGGLVRSSSVPQLQGTRDGYLYSSMYRPWMRTVDFWLDEHAAFGSYLWKELYKTWERVSRSVTASSRPQAAKTEVADGNEVQSLLDELESVRGFVREKNTRLVILSIVGQERDGAFSHAQKRANDRLLTWCKAKEIPCVNVLPPFEAQSGGAPLFRFEHDPHWSPRAHAVAAEEIARVLVRDGVPPVRALH